MIRYTLVLCLLYGAFVWADAPNSAHTPGVVDQSEFEIEGGLIDKIFEQNAKASNLELIEEHSSWRVTTGLSVFNAQSFSLMNPYFDVNYAEKLHTLPSFRVALAAPILNWSGLQASLSGRVAYSYHESLYSVRSKTGASLTDSIRLHWLPVSAGLTIDYEIPRFSFVRPSIGGGVGLQWIYQQGKLDGLEQGFWIPFAYAEAAITLFPSLDWFGGVKLGASIVQSLDASQQVSGWTMDAGLQFRL